MLTATIRLRSLAPYSQSRIISQEFPRKDRETWDEYEARVWREKAHFADGVLVIPPMAFKQALDAAAKYRGEKIPGSRGKTWSAKFRSGVLCATPLSTGIRREDVAPITICANADGKRGSGTRVMRTFPQVPKWEGDLVIHVLDPEVTEAVLVRHLETAGMLIGVGRFRAEVGGSNGRFAIVSSKFEES